MENKQHKTLIINVNFIFPKIFKIFKNIVNNY